jgi:hypothetical protein
MPSIKAESGHINLSPITFRQVARDFFKCYLDFKPLDSLSIVPFFLCCRAIEIALKAEHLENNNQEVIKKKYRHNLEKLYMDLPSNKQTLSVEEHKLLKQANDIYNKNKELEYMHPYDAVTNLKDFPDLYALAEVARKLTNYDERMRGTARV